MTEVSINYTEQFTQWYIKHDLERNLLTCRICSYDTYRKSDFSKHLKSFNHLDNLESFGGEMDTLAVPLIPEQDTFCPVCKMSTVDANRQGRLVLLCDGKDRVIHL